MSDLRREVEARRKEAEMRNAINLGMSELKDGSKIYTSDDKKRAGIIPRTVADKLNYSLLLQKQIDNCNFVGMYSYEAFARSVIILLQMIPDADQDEMFREDIQKATFKVRVPTGRYSGFGGSVYEVCKEATEYDHLKIFRAIIDVIRRRGIISTPKLWDEQQSEIFWKRGGSNPPVKHAKKKRKKR